MTKNVMVWLACALILALIIISAPVTAEEVYSTYRLKDIRIVYSKDPLPSSPLYHIDDVHADSKGGYFKFTQFSDATSGDCKGTRQSFSVEWTFDKDISVLSGKVGDRVCSVKGTITGDSDGNCLSGNDLRLTVNNGAYGGSTPSNLPQPFSDAVIEYHYWQPGNKNAWMWNPAHYYSDDHVNPGSIDIFLGNNNFPGGAFTLWTLIKPVNHEVYFQYIYEGVSETGTGTSGGGSGGCSWTGTWKTDFNDMTLTQSGSAVTGTYGYDNGRIEGTVSGNTLSGRWSEAPSYKEPNDAGRFVFTLGSDCTSFTGTWGYGGESTGSAWSGTLGGGSSTPAGGTTATTSTATTRVTTPATGGASGTSGGGSGGCSWTGTWKTDFNDMTLTQSGSAVTGTYGYDNGRIEGTVSGNTLSGRWSEAPSYKEPNDAGRFVFTLGSDCTSFTGTWGYGGESTGSAWSGTLGGGSSTPAGGTTAATPTATTRVATPATGGASGTSGGRTGCPASGTLVYVGQWRPSTGQTLEIPIMICNAVDLANMDLTATYDPKVLTFVEAKKGGLLGSGFLFESNDQGGKIRISFASKTGVSGSGSIAILVFKVAGQTGSSTTIGGTITNAGTGSGTTTTIPSFEPGGVSVTVPNPLNPDGGQCGPTSLTALKALQMAVGKIPVDITYDVTRDGSVNSADAREILRLAAAGGCQP
jgi:hypothetical protein